jgi:hypothetical protein
VGKIEHFWFAGCAGSPNKDKRDIAAWCLSFKAIAAVLKDILGVNNGNINLAGDFGVGYQYLGVGIF